MKVAELSFAEDLRLSDLYRYRILDTPREEAFEELVELVHLTTGCPLVAIGFMDRDRYWLKATKGFEAESVERNLSICSHTIRQNGQLVVENLRGDHRFTAHPAVEGGLCLRFYAGSSILSAQGHAVGTVCVADTKPRTFTHEQRRSLEIIAHQVRQLLESRLKQLHLQSRAGHLIALEQKTVQRNLVQQEEERQVIGYELHERFAQALAACHTFLGVAESDESLRLSLINKTRVELQRLTREMRSFSRRFTPTTLEHFDAAEMVRALVRQVEGTVSFSIRLQTTGDTRHLSREKGLAIFRNTQEFLQLIAASGDVSAVVVRLKVDTTVSLLLMDNRPPQTAFSLEQDTLVRTIHNRTLHFGGTVQYKPSSHKGNALLIAVPLV